MKTYSWVYQDRILNDLVLVMKPHRRAVERKYRVLQPHFRRNGFRPESVICVSGRTFDSAEFRSRFEYVGGLNTSANRCKMIHIVQVGEDYTFTWKGDSYTEPDWYYPTKQSLMRAVNKLKIGSYPKSGVHND